MSALPRDMVADIRLQSAIGLARDGEFAAARSQLLGTEHYLATECPDTLPIRVERTRVARVSAEVDMRWALEPGTDHSFAVATLERARHGLIKGLTLTGMFVTGISLPDFRPAASEAATAVTDQSETEFASAVVNESLHGTPKRVRREIYAAHGMTFSRLARVATSREVLLGIDSRGNTPEAREARLGDQQYYGAACDMLRMAGHWLEFADLALAGARQEVLNDRPPQMLVWLQRAGNGMRGTALHDRSNLWRASEVAARRRRHLRSYATAQAGVRLDP